MLEVNLTSKLIISDVLDCKGIVIEKGSSSSFVTGKKQLKCYMFLKVK